jgi:DNA anti-recombination protein RmuC
VIETWLIRGLRGLLVAGSLLASLGGQAALFSDDEARKAIIDLRQRVDAQKATAEAIEKRLTDENNQLRRSLLDLQNQIETLRAEQARMRGQASRCPERSLKPSAARPRKASPLTSACGRWSRKR